MASVVLRYYGLGTETWQAVDGQCLCPVHGEGVAGGRKGQDLSKAEPRWVPLAHWKVVRRQCDMSMICELLWKPSDGQFGSVKTEELWQ